MSKVEENSGMLTPLIRSFEVIAVNFRSQCQPRTADNYRELVLQTPKLVSFYFLVGPTEAEQTVHLGLNVG